MKNALSLAMGLVAAVAVADTPDYIADKIVSDGSGYVDTGCKFIKDQTSRVWMSFNTKSRGWDLGTENADRRCLFAIWRSSGNDRSVACYYNSDLQIWGGNGDIKGINTDFAKSGDVTVEHNYLTGAFEWLQPGVSGSRSGTVKAPTATSAVNYYLFGWQYGGGGRAAVSMYKFCLYEKIGDAEETLAHEFVPCCKDGKAAVYDTKTQAIAFPSTDGFDLVGDYSLSVAADSTLYVTKLTCQPQSLSFAGAAEIVFDGTRTLSSESTVTLPASGKLAVSLSEMQGKRRYVLMDNLPADFDLSRFELGDLPTGCTGTLAKEDDSLVLILDGGDRYWPDALGETLTSDANGHIDTGYSFVGTKFPKTARVSLDLYTTNNAVGSAGGPQAGASKTRSLFGYLCSDGNMVSYAKWTGANAPQMWGGNWDYWEGSPVKGSDTVEINYLAETAKWGTTSGQLNPPTKDSTYSYWLFAVHNGTGYSANPCVYDFKRFRIWETADGTTETLAHDFVPCVNNGRAAVCDWLTGDVKYPEADTNGFVCAGLEWRVRVNGETVYRTAGTSVTFSCGEDAVPDGYVAVNDADGSVVARGSGASATFTVPAAPISVHWSHNLSVAADETLTVSGDRYCHNLTLADGARINYQTADTIYLSGAFALASGSVRIGYSALVMPGERGLVVGGVSAASPSAFEIAATPFGMSGAIERHGDSIVIVLRDSDSAIHFGEKLTTDKVGWIDTGYLYKTGAVCTTTRVIFDFNTVNYGYPSGVKATNSPSIFGYHQNGKNLSYCRYSGGSYVWGTQVWSGNNITNYVHIDAFGTPNGRQTIKLDYEKLEVTWNSMVETNLFYPCTTSASRSYWLAGVNGNNSPSYMDIIGFKAWQKDGDGAETLACDIVPATRGGVPGAYDRAAQCFIEPSYPSAETTNGFTVDFGSVTQRFYAVGTVAEGFPVAVPDFGVEREFTFVRDGCVKAKLALASVKLTRYDAEGGELDSETLTSVAAGETVAVSLGDAAKVVVTVVPTYPAEKTVAQSFDKVSTLSVAPTSFKRLRKAEYQVAVAGATTLTFAAEVVSVVAEDYDADGALTGSETLAGEVAAGQSLEVAAGSGAYRILKIEEGRPGLILIVR